MPDARSPRSRKSWDSCSFIKATPHNSRIKPIGLPHETSDVQRAAGGAQSEWCGVALSCRTCFPFFTARPTVHSPRRPSAGCPRRSACLSMPEGWQRSRRASCVRITYPGRLYPVL